MVSTTIDVTHTLPLATPPISLFFFFSICLFSVSVCLLSRFLFFAVPHIPPGFFSTLYRRCVLRISSSDVVDFGLVGNGDGKELRGEVAFAYGACAEVCACGDF